MKKYVATIIVILALTCLLIPYRTVLVPKWRVQLVNEDGVPYPGKLVRQFCINYTLDVNPCYQAQDDTYRYTDENGYVEFSEKSFSLNPLSRIIRTLKSYIFIIAHGSVGTDIYIDTTGPAGQKVVQYVPGSGPPPERIVLPSKSGRG